MSKKFVANGFATELPENWADRSVITLLSTIAPSGFATNVVVLREEIAAQTSIEEYAKEQIALSKQQVENFRLLDQRPVSIQGKPAYQTLQRFTANQREIQQAQTFILIHQTILAFTFTALLNEFDSSIPAFREIMDNLTFTEEN
jgi:hypothetical protein